MISKSLNSVHKLKKVKAILTTRKSKKIKKKEIIWIMKIFYIWSQHWSIEIKKCTFSKFEVYS